MELDQELQELFEKINNNEYFELSFKNLNKMTEDQRKFALGKLATLSDDVIRDHQRKRLSQLMMELENRVYTPHENISLTKDEINDIWHQLHLLKTFLRENK